MQLVGEYKGIGKVYTSHTQQSQLSYAKIRSGKLLTAADFLTTATSLLSNQSSASFAIFSSEITKTISRETMESLELRGVSCVRFNQELPLGGFALDAFTSSMQIVSKQEVSSANQDDIFVLYNNFYGKFAVASKAALPMSKDAIEKAAFADISSTAQVIALCRHTDNACWEWGPSCVYPDGFHIQPPLTATEQYAQSCFEGMVASINKNGEIILFRPDRNAARFAYSCEALAIPPVSQEQFVDAVKTSILANRQYLPSAGSNTKLYIRPYAKGLDGGYGVGPADNYLFAIEVFPYGDYFSGTLDIISIPGTRRSHEGGFGSVKASGNYGQTILSKVKAKKGLIAKDGKVFQDTFYFGERKQQIKLDGQTYTTVEDVIDEDSAGNLLFLKSTNGKTALYTAPMDRKAVLAGITRESLLILAKYAGYDVIEKELNWNELSSMDVGFVSGTAAGMVRIGSMTYGDNRIEFAKATDTGPALPSLQAFTKLYDLLFAARKGELRHIDDFGIKDWAVIVGKL